MPSGASLLSHWYFHVPNLILVALIYALIARAVLGAILGSANPFTRAFGVVTQPVLSAVGVVTPRIVPPLLLIAFAVVWLLVVRMALIFAVTAMGLRPS
jgi:YggT family protein